MIFSRGLLATEMGMALSLLCLSVWLNSLGTGYLECMQCLAGPTASRDGYFSSSMRFLRAFRICTPTHVIHIYQARPLVVTAPTYTEVQDYDKQYKSNFRSKRMVPVLS